MAPHHGKRCMEGGVDCRPATRPDPRFPKLEEGDRVLCEDCYQNALDELAADVEAQRD